MEPVIQKYLTALETKDFEALASGTFERGQNKTPVLRIRHAGRS